MQTSTAKSLSVLLVLLMSAFGLRAAIYKESGGIVVVEAEHFDSRTTNSDNHHWHVVPDDNGVDFLADSPGDSGVSEYLNPRGNKYVQSLPPTVTAYNTVPLVGIDPHLDFKVQITTPGVYRLWVRWGGYDGVSDSLYGQIIELMTPSGPGPDWYRFARQSVVGGVPDFNMAWDGSGAPSTDAVNNVNGGGGEVPAVWTLSGGTYTVRFTMREDGSAVDAFILQLNSLAAPANPGPAESATTTTFININPQPADVTVANNQPLTFTVGATGSATPTYQWQKAAAGSTNFTDIPGATGTSYATGALTVADNGTKYRVIVSIPGLSVPSRAATVTIDATSPTIASLSGNPSLTGVTVVFSEPVTAATAGNPTNYVSDGSLTISAATVINPTTVRLTTSRQTSGTTYTLTVNNIRDTSSGGGNAILANSQKSFTAIVLQVLTARTFGQTNKVRVFFNEPVTPSGATTLLSDDFSAPAIDPSKWSPDNKPFELGASTSFSVVQSNGTAVFKLTVTDQYWPGAALATVSSYSASTAQPLTFEIDRVSHKGTGTASRTGVWISDATRANYVLFAENVGEGNWQFNRQIGLDFDNPTGVGKTIPLFNNTAGFTDGANHHIKLVADGQYVKLYLDDQFGTAVPFPITSGIVFEFGTYARATNDTITGVFDNALVTKASAPSLSTFTIDNGVTVTGVAFTSDPSVLELTTSPIAPGGTYMLTVNGVQGIGGNTIAPNTKMAIGLTGPNATYTAGVLVDRPVAYYQLAELTGLTAPNLGTFGSDLDATYFSGPAQGAAGPRPLAVPGFDAENLAQFFDGLTNFITIPPDPSTGVSVLQDLAAFTLECWAKPGNFTATRLGLVGQNDAFEFGFISPTTVEIYTQFGGTLDTPYPFPKNEWHHIVCVGDGTNLRIYYDGAVAGTGGTVTADYGSSIYPVNIGGGGVQDATGNFFLGLIDEVAIYTNALSAARIKAHYDLGAGTALKPTVAITGPTNRATFLAGASVTIVATATPTGTNSITKVEFFLGGTNKVGEATSAPFQVSVPSLATGRYQATARATDSQGFFNVSATVKFTVGTPPPEVLMLVANGPTPNPSDLAAISRLQSLGFDVTVQGALVSQTADAQDKALIVSSSTVPSADVANKFQTAPVPVVNWENALQDNYLFTLDTATDHNVTTGLTQTDIIITDATHPLAAGLSAGTHSVVTSGQDFSWGVPAASAKIVATLADGTGNAPIYGFEKGALLIDGVTPAPARRVHFLMTDNTFLALNADGLALFDAAVKWAANLAQRPVIAAPTLSGSTISFTWTGGGQLQEATDLNGSWGPVAGNPQGTYSVQTTGTRKFYRVIIPGSPLN